MSTNNTLRMINAYYQDAAPTMFLSGMFQSPQVNFYNGEEVELDVMRGDEQVAVIVDGKENGWRMNSADVYTNKKFRAPVFKEAMAFNSFDLLKRAPGEDPFRDPAYRANLITNVFRGMRKIEQKIHRAIELQASQILQTGTLTFENTSGTTVDSVSFSPKSSHFFTAGTAWDAAGGDPIGDIDTLANLIRVNGLTDADQLVMGDAAFNAFVQHADVQARFDNRRYEFGRLAPEMRGQGGTYQGEVVIGNYRYSIWTYSGRYNDASSGVSTRYIGTGNCIVRSSGARLDATFGNIPNIGKIVGGLNTGLLPELPRRLSSAARGMDLHVNVWMTPDGEQLFGGVASRPLLIPTAIDTFGTIATGAT